jgi:hypothetical protein
MQAGSVLVVAHVGLFAFAVSFAAGSSPLVNSTPAFTSASNERRADTP